MRLAIPSTMERVDVQARLTSKNYMGESHAELSDSHHRIRAGEVQAGARTAATGVWLYSQPRCRNCKFAQIADRVFCFVSAGTQQQPYRTGDSGRSAHRRSHELL